MRGRKSNRKEKSSVVRVLNKSLKPVESAFTSTKNVLQKARRKAPSIFNSIESVFKSHFISMDAGKKLKSSLDITKFFQIVGSWIIHKLPNVDEQTMKQFTKDKTIVYLNSLTRGIGNPEEIEKEYTKIKKDKLFKRILIANRGEIALRIIRACRELGIKTIQIYTKQDAKSLAVKFADKAVNLGKDAAAYLDMQRIIKIAKKMKADAIHPGYGFLAENPEFSKLCKENKIKFIGPSEEAIKAMGDKINAKKLIKNSGVLVLEGTEKVVIDIREGKEIAKQIGYPIIIKAAAGGGGKGMRIVEHEHEFEKAFQACQTEALNSFKSKDVFIEKYLVDPKHIEFQILGDSKGRVIHLGERDCSIQRRYQKLIEEAPSPSLSPELREKMGEAALKIASAVRYEGAGTIEFLLDKSNNFYFMEMNTRIQVEHGITEMITGIDLVKEQIKVAAGAALVVKQEDVKITGWAIECRINAECPFEEFCPATGTISNYLPPGGPGIRVCSSCHTGQEVSPHYDSMIAKLMCFGKTRQEAIDRMKRALEEFIIEGVDTTIPFHKAVLNSTAFFKGDITTGFIDKHRIIRKLKLEYRKKRKAITQQERAIIISTAVTDYLKKRGKGFNDKNSAWANAARQEAVMNE
jgi:acetyl-CoA carboxylase biotin carboxylase subunit